MSLRLPVIAGPVDTGHPATIAGDPGDLDPLLDQRAVLPRAFGQRQRDIGRIGLTVGRQPDTAGHAVEVDMLIFLKDFLGRQLLDRNTKGAGHRRLAEKLLAPLIGQRDGNRPALTQPGGDAGFLLKAKIQFRGIARELGHVLRCAQLPDQARRMPGCPAGQLLAFQQHDIFPSELGQVIGHRTADDTAADNHHTGLGGKFHVFVSCQFGQNRTLRQPQTLCVTKTLAWRLFTKPHDASDKAEFSAA